jgi:hypothetical protein
MSNHLAEIISRQYEASLCMLEACVRECKEPYWEGLIANGSFRWNVYHTLFFTDYYLAPREDAFELRELHLQGGDERGPEACPGLSQADSLAYATICREKGVETLARESPAILEGPSGFERKRFCRAELHLYNIRHVQHHTGQLSAYLRRVDPELRRRDDALPWVGSGWRQP